MAVKETPVQFKTSDGKTFDTREEAERHELLRVARDEFEQARTVLARLLAESHQTADGRRFSFDQWQYYYIAPGWEGLPRLTRVMFHGFNLDWESQFDGREFPVIRQWEGEGKDRRLLTYRFDCLYGSERAAEKALLAAQEKRLAELAESIEDLRAKVNGHA
jgi:hypothetical protein